MARKIKLTESVSISELKHMREVEGLSNAEIAKRVNMSLAGVKQAIRIISEKSGLPRADFAAIL